MILGAEFQTSSPSETPLLVSQLIDNLNYRLSISKDWEAKLMAILDTHIQFERIQPFSDGNGRTGRMMMNYSLLQEGFSPLIIEKDTKAQYVEVLATQDVDSFLSFATDTLVKDKKEWQRFKIWSKKK